MRLIVFILLCGFAAAWAGIAATGQDETLLFPQKTVIPQQILVKYREPNLKKTGLANREWQKVQQRYRLTSIEPLFPDRFLIPEAGDWHVVHFADSRNPHEVAAAMRTLEGIQIAEPRYSYPLLILPNDSLFSLQSHLQQIAAPQAWELARAEQGDAIIAIVDGGTDIRHPDLQANLWRNSREIPNNSIDDDQNGFIDDIHGWNFATEQGDPSPLPSQPINGYHGTHVAGLASAVTDNRIGVAGSSWNARLMIVNASSPNQDRSILYGFEGILYAAANGAKIINCSWGAIGSYSEYEEWVIEQTTAWGAVVVAAAGNDGQDGDHYPSSYSRVFSVTAVNSADQKASIANYGPTVDLSAPGINLLSTIPGNSYGTATGTSMAAPLVSGVLALVAVAQPNGSGLQWAEQVRATADPIDVLNPDHRFQLGRGRVNAFRAVSEKPPGIEISQVTIVDQNGEQTADPGDRLHLTLELYNYLAAASDLTVEVISSDPLIEVTDPLAFLSELPKAAQAEIGPFRLSVSPQVPRGSLARLRISFASDEHTDFRFITVPIAPLYAVSDINDLRVTLTPLGRIGTPDPLLPLKGVGVRYKMGLNLLFEGSIVAGTGPARISNAARSILDPELTFDSDFVVDTEGDLRILRPGPLADLQTRAQFTDEAAENPLNIRIVQESFAEAQEPYRDCIVLRYRIENSGSSSLENFYFGLFFDWDIGGSALNRNRVDYDPDRQMGYAYGGDDQLTEYAGVRFVNSEKISYRALYNDPNHADNPSWGLYDGFSDSEKWQAISSGISLTHAGPADVSHSLASGPHRIAAGDTLELGVALMAGHSLTQLQQAADHALTYWRSHVDSTSAGNSTCTGLTPPYPNPFHQEIVIPYSLGQRGAAELSIYDLLGRHIDRLVQGTKNAGCYTKTWNGKDSKGQRLPAGVYFIRLQTTDSDQAQKIVLLP
ncbi:S8 family serine peptidase [candidate division KSB1 bacterium]|nr:S8 family serine peptidase [candidate division KSB1 bacterium]